MSGGPLCIWGLPSNSLHLVKVIDWTCEKTVTTCLLFNCYLITEGGQVQAHDPTSEIVVKQKPANSCECIFRCNLSPCTARSGTAPGSPFVFSLQQFSLFSFSMQHLPVSPPRVSGVRSIKPYFRMIRISMLPGYQRRCCTMSAFRPFLTSEPKRQGPRKDEELVI